MHTDDNEAAVTIDDSGNAALIDLSGVDENASDFEPLPRGEYNVVVNSVEYGLSQRSNNPMWTWSLEVSEGEYASRYLWYHTVLNAKGAKRLKQALMAVGKEDLATGSFDPQDLEITEGLAGTEARVRVDVRPGRDGNGPSNNVKSMRASGGGEDFLDG